MRDQPRDALFVAYDPFRPRHSRYAQRRGDDMEHAHTYNPPGHIPPPPIPHFEHPFRYPDSPRIPVSPRPASDCGIVESPVRSYGRAMALGCPQYHTSTATIPQSASDNEPHTPLDHSPQEPPSSAVTDESSSSSYLPSHPTPWYSEGLHESSSGISVAPGSPGNHPNTPPPLPPLPEDVQSRQHTYLSSLSYRKRPSDQISSGGNVPGDSHSGSQTNQPNPHAFPLPLLPVYLQPSPLGHISQVDIPAMIPGSQEIRSSPRQDAPRPISPIPHGVIVEDFPRRARLSTITERTESSPNHSSGSLPPVPYDEGHRTWHPSLGDHGWASWQPPQPWSSYPRVGGPLSVGFANRCGGYGDNLHRPHPSALYTPALSSTFSSELDVLSRKPGDNIGASKSRYVMALLFESVPQQIYLHFLLRLPSLYFSRVARVFEDAELSLSDIEKMAVTRMEEWHSNSKIAERIPSQALWEHEKDRVSPALRQFKPSWEDFVGSLIKEWKVLNIISALLASAILSLLQLDAAMADVVTKSTALLSLVCALMSLLYCCIYIIRFGTMRKMHKAASWADEARQTETRIIWNVWVMLAMPAVWLCWAIILFLASIMSFVWRSALSRDGEEPKEAFQEQLGSRVAISTLLILGLCYFIQLIGTFRRYGDLMDRIWRDRLLIKWKRTKYLSPIDVPLLSPRRSSPVREFHPTQLIRGFRSSDRQPSPQHTSYPWNEIMQPPPRSPRRPSPEPQFHPTHMYRGFEHTHQIEPSLSYPWNDSETILPSRHSSPRLGAIPSAVIANQLESQQHERRGSKDPRNNSDRIISGKPYYSPSPHHRDLNAYELFVDGKLAKETADSPGAKSRSENSSQYEAAGAEAGIPEEHIIRTTGVHQGERNSNLSLLELKIHEL